MKKKIKLFLVFFWMICIFLFSNQPGTDSDSLTHNVIDTGVKVTETVTNTKISEQKVESITQKIFKPLRKFSHFFEYLLLGVLVYSLLCEYSISTKKRILFTILFCVFYASTDEFHQLFVSGRTAKVIDVCIDGCGATVGTLLYLAFIKVSQALKNRTSKNLT